MVSEGAQTPRVADGPREKEPRGDECVSSLMGMEVGHLSAIEGLNATNRQ